MRCLRETPQRVRQPFAKRRYLMSWQRGTSKALGLHSSTCERGECTIVCPPPAGCHRAPATRRSPDIYPPIGLVVAGHVCCLCAEDVGNTFNCIHLRELCTAVAGHFFFSARFLGLRLLSTTPYFGIPPPSRENYRPSVRIYPPLSSQLPPVLVLSYMLSYVSIALSVWSSVDLPVGR